MAQLRERLGATPEEIAAWVFISTQHLCAAKDDSGEKCCTNEVLHRGDKCKQHGRVLTPEDEAKLNEHKRHNLVAFTDANELDPPPRFFFGNYAGKRDYLPLLYRYWFKADDIAKFEPGDRYITGEMLLKRWAARNVIPPAERIRIATSESRLMPLHPTLGLTQATFSDDADYAPLEDGLFSLTEVKAYEREEFGGELDATGESSDAAAKGEAGTGTSTSPSGEGWEAKARTLADECFDHDTKCGTRDSLAHSKVRGRFTGGYAFRVMELMQERGIKGARGIIDNPATIMREALQGKKWWANKSK